MSLIRSEAVIALGKRLVAQLGAKGDVLTSWMAHHVADLMARAEAAPPAEKAVAQEACARAVLDLWRHRNVLPEILRFSSFRISAAVSSSKGTGAPFFQRTHVGFGSSVTARISASAGTAWSPVTCTSPHR